MKDERAANKVDKLVGARVRTRRLEIGMSQERLADLLGVTFQQVQKYEKGVNRIAAGRLYDISEALDVNAAYFFENLSKEDSRKKDDDGVAEAMTDPDTIELVQLYSKIKSKRVKRRVLELVRAMEVDG